MFSAMLKDCKAVRRNDPSANSYLEIALCHTPLHAIAIYRLARVFHRARVPILPRLMSVFARFWSGVDIHPGAEIGAGFFIDHGTGVVIGETAEIGENCIMFHNVTLGGTGKFSAKRHPTLGNYVYLGAGAVLLGPINVGSGARVGANAFILMQDVPADTTVVGVPARIVRSKGQKVDLALPATAVPREREIPFPVGGLGQQSEQLAVGH